MKKLFFYLLLLLPLAGCSVEFYYDDTYPPEPPYQEIITYIRDGGPYENITAVVVNNEIRANSYYGPTVAIVADDNCIYENSIYGRILGYIDGNYILDAPNGRTVAFIDRQYILEAPYGRIIAYMDGPADPIAGGLGAIYMLLFY